ncbi:MAG: protease inhibitor I42 family protein [Candidatus Margulisbacteria bacterium]|nr:protease inhibitor I42 family protein [Candidatus Margulisiibacteriota bacterium]MBU1616571.1 protease inhibitor I42 family protein [Candidatus Margulisiibacteriota bacterium]
MKFSFGVLLIFSLVFFFIAYTFFSQPGSTIKLYEKDNGGEVHLNVNDNLIITLETNPTTGYNWEIKKTNPLILKQTAPPQFISKSKLVGAPGQIIFTFTAIAPGSADLVFDYRRPWDTETDETKGYKISLLVKQ